VYKELQFVSLVDRAARTVKGKLKGLKCLFSFSQDCPLLPGSLALEALLIGVHCKKRYINV